MPASSTALLALGALGDPTRRSIFEGLREQPAAVNEIAARLPVSRPAVSQHLKVLKEAGLVTDEAQGARRVYRIDPRGIGAMREWLDQYLGDALEAFRGFADAQEDAEHERRK